MLYGIKRFIKSRKYLSHLAAFALFEKQTSYLKKTGWFESFRKGLPSDSLNRPLPWYTYSAIEFLSERTNKNMKIFEFGCGNSTLWWSKRAGHVTSCEHDADWFRRLRALCPENVRLIHRDISAGSSYAEAARHCGPCFDIIIIDGILRLECAFCAPDALGKSGVVIWDNNYQKEYEEGYDFLRSKGFKNIDFVGFGPVNTFGWRTTVFYKEGNCLGL